jgi:NAD(P)-dependent dehydrogenase (short-subunit alcohol dehydrogenase family)
MEWLAGGGAARPDRQRSTISIGEKLFEWRPDWSNVGALIKSYTEFGGNFMDLGLNGKRAIVTGASRGIGNAVALALGGEGARVCVTARNEELLAQTVKDIDAAGGEGMSAPADLTGLDGCQSVVDACAANWGGVDILVNVAGAAKGGDILDLPADLVSDALALKSFGYLRMAQLVIPHMQTNKWGRIVNIGGGAGASPARGNIPTSIANAMVLNTTRALSDAVSGDGILVNVINPGVTNTQRARDTQQARADKQGVSVEDLLKDLGSKLPAGRIAEPEEIARVACFFASAACSYVFGSSLYMDGGQRRSTP